MMLQNAVARESIEGANENQALCYVPKIQSWKSTQTLHSLVVYYLNGNVVIKPSAKQRVQSNLSVSKVDFSYRLQALSGFLALVSTLEFHIMRFSLWEYPTPPCLKQAGKCLTLKG